MEVIQIEVFEFDELSDAAKDKARAWYAEFALDYEWWDSVYEDAENIGLKITGHGDHNVQGRFVMSATDTANLILSEYGNSCGTSRSAERFLDDVTDEAEFLRDLCEDYRIMLNNEAEYLTSNESVDEAIRANEYTFTADGKRFG